MSIMTIQAKVRILLENLNDTEPDLKVQSLLPVLGALNADLGALCPSLLQES
jgi:hypothetical protein